MRRPYARGVTAIAAILTMAACGDDDSSAPTVSVLSWSGPKLSGETELILAGGDTSFDGEVPQPIAIIDAATTCEAVQAEYDFWFPQADESTLVGERISAYAQHAKDRLVELGC